MKSLVERLCAALAHDDPSGLGDREYELGDLCALLPDAEPAFLQEAIAELEHDGLVSRTRFLGGSWSIELTAWFYEQVDPDVKGWVPANDAAHLAQLVITDPTLTQARELERASRFGRRQFNPAFRRFLDLLPPGRASRTLQPDYPAKSFHLLPEDTVTLKRFIESRR